MISSSKSRGIQSPTFTKEEFIEWCIRQDKFFTLYTNWILTDDRMMLVSIDRLNDNIGYIFDNMQLITWGENNKKPRNKSSFVKGVYSIDKHGNKTFYESQAKAGIELGISNKNISAVCLGKRSEAGGLKWIFAYTDDLDE